MNAQLTIIAFIQLNSIVSKTTDGEKLRPDAKIWLVRGKEVLLNHNKEDYIDAGIKLDHSKPNELRIEEAARLIILRNHELFRATDEELYKSIPSNLKKILVIDEWFHKDFHLQISPTITDEHLHQVYEFNENLNGLNDMSFESFAQLYKQKEILNNDWNKEALQNNRPGSYETWQQIAKVIANNDPSNYRPTLRSNTHWTNWPDSGSM